MRNVQQSLYAARVLRYITPELVSIIRVRGLGDLGRRPSADGLVRG